MDDILKLMLLREAVRTSILSRSWRHKWLTIPYLIFDSDFKRKLQGRNNNIESVIYQVFVQHRGPILKFTYSACTDSNTCPALEHWLNFLSNHRIEELTLRFFSKTPQTIPHHLFTFDHLTHLHLHSCELQPPLAFRGFDRLITLELHLVLIEPGKFVRLMSQFPMLEHLTFSSNHFIYPDFEIDAPNLKSFCFSISNLFPSICFKSTSYLEEVSIHSYGSYEFSQGCLRNLIDFFGQLSSITKMVLQDRSLELFSIGGVPQKLPNNLGYLIDLRCHINFASIAEVSGALCLIRSSPKLQSLKISSTFFNEGDVKPAAQFLKEQQNHKVTPIHLKNVKIDFFCTSESEMEFVKLLLSVATSLLKLELKLNPLIEYAAGEEYRMLRELARFRRASPEAEIIIQDNANVA